jgi:hypothetical protein
MYAELTIDQGATFSSTLDLTNDDNTPMNLANTTFVAQVRKSYYSTHPTANLVVAVDGDSANGRIRMSLDEANTANIKPGRYVYDLKMTTEANVTIRVVEGIMTVTPQVSR